LHPNTNIVENDFEASTSELDGLLAAYTETVKINDTDARLEVLIAMKEAFDSIRLGSDLFIAGTFFDTPPQYYVLKKNDTNQCLGPRKGSSGLPTCKQNTSDVTVATYLTFHVDVC
jgi:hypothetical protein